MSDGFEVAPYASSVGIYFPTHPYNRGVPVRAMCSHRVSCASKFKSWTRGNKELEFLIHNTS